MTAKPSPVLISIENLDKAFPSFSSPQLLPFMKRGLPPFRESLAMDPLPSSNVHRASRSSFLTTPAKSLNASKARHTIGLISFLRHIHLQYSRNNAHKSNLPAHVSKLINKEKIISCAKYTEKLHYKVQFEGLIQNKLSEKPLKFILNYKK